MSAILNISALLVRVWSLANDFICYANFSLFYILQNTFANGEHAFSVKGFLSEHTHHKEIYIKCVIYLTSCTSRGKKL